MKQKSFEKKTNRRCLHSLAVAGITAITAIQMARAGDEPANKCIVPGEVWRDTDGKPINAHGGGVLFHDGTYYWYGELKEGQTYLPKVNKKWGGTRVISGGVSCYSSTNLYDWKNEGVALPADAKNPDSDLACENVIERPKVIYNAATKKFVMWFHQDSPDYAAARAGVAVSDTPAGPFKYLGSFRPDKGVWPVNVTSRDKKNNPENFLARDFAGGQMARDMNLFVDDDGKAYQFYASENNGTMHVSQLSDDYLRPAGKFARIFIDRMSEAPSVFKRDGKYYMICSGCSGWDPNTARSAVATNIFGPWTELGNPCRGTNADITFFCQSTYVLPVAGKTDQFIAMFDRWEKWKLQDSRYVWLPVEFDADEHPLVQWQDRWTLPLQKLAVEKITAK
jgi:Glycosyl hydrolases family 43